MNPDSNDFQKNIGNENYVPDDSVPLPSPDVTEDLSAEANNSSQEGTSHLYIGNKTKITMGYGMDKCSHSSTTGLHNMTKTGKMKANVKSIGDPDSVGTEETPMPALKAPVDVYKDPGGDDEENMGKAVEIRKIATESDTTSPMEVREQGENVVIIGGGLDDTVTVRTTDSATSAQIMTWLDGILISNDTATYTPPTDYDGYGKNLNLVVRQKDYYRLDLGLNEYLMVDANTVSSAGNTKTYYWRNGVYMGVDLIPVPAGVGVVEETVDNWTPSGSDPTYIEVKELSVCVGGSPVMKKFVVVDW